MLLVYVHDNGQSRIKLLLIVRGTYTVTNDFETENHHLNKFLSSLRLCCLSVDVTGHRKTAWACVHNN